MKIDKKHIPLLGFIVLFMLIFSIIYIARKNYEFIIYIGVTIFFLGVILASYRKVKYTDASLYGLSIWAFLHMAGGAIFIGDTRLYELILIPVSEKYQVFRYDQFVHIVGFGVSTIVMYCVLKPLLKEKIERFFGLSIVVVMAGLGIGAFNEIVEFFVAVIVSESGVGGYINTSLDLVADLVGAVLGMVYIRIRYLPREPADNTEQ